eukprot:4411456-Pyramimonas_sp.AAC.1
MPYPVSGSRPVPHRASRASGVGRCWGSPARCASCAALGPARLDAPWRRRGDAGAAPRTIRPVAVLGQA